RAESNPPAAQPQQDPERIEPEKLIFLLQYVGTDYGAAVESGQVVSEFEYQEMLDFSQLLVEQYRQLRPSEDLLSQLEEVRQLIQEKRDWSEIRDLTQHLVPQLSQQLNVISYPIVVPNLSRGQKLFAKDCARCHGVGGEGDGPSAAELNPPPRSFQDLRVNQLAPNQIFNAVTFGVEGTEMPSHLESLNDQERWDIAFRVLTFRHDFNPVRPENPLPFSLKDLAVHSNDELVAQLAENGIEAKIAHVDYYRQNPPGASLEDLLVLAQQKLHQSAEAYQRGEVGQALKLTLDAYLEGVEPVEPALQQKDRSLAAQLESEFSLYRIGLRSGAPAADVAARYQSLRDLTRRAQQILRHSEATSGFAFVQSLTIILREGVEAALLLGLMVTYLSAAGYERLQKYIVLGAGIGVLLGIVTWWTAQFAIEISPFQQEALEGITSLLAAAVLFSVSFWVIRQVDIRHWKKYIKKRAEEALGTGSGLALASAAFLAVYREAVETVLFYEALWVRSESAQDSILTGFAAGTVLLLLLVFLMFKFGLRIPLKQFFAITGVLLGLLAFVFAGYGVRELQAVGWIKETPLKWMVRFSLLEVRPTLESFALQFGILLSFLIGWFQLSKRASPAATEAR
ncbi:MAG: FTR1 family protein, partial [Acidobacteriota bacterium]